MSPSEEESTSVNLTTNEAPSFELIEVEPGVAVVFGDQPPADFDVMPFELMTPETTQSLTDKLAVASGLGNIVAQATQGVMSTQGLVRFDTRTMKLLQTARPMMSEGQNLGAIMGSNGKIAAMVRWAPATGAQAASFASAIGPAGALLALQVQLASISRRVDENIELTREVLKDLHQDQWSTLIGLHNTTLRAVEEAKAVGFVNNHIFSALRTKESDIRTQRDRFKELLLSHIKELDTDIQSRRVYLQKNVEQIFADTHGVLMAEGSWHRYQVLRAAHISNDVTHAVENEKLLAKLVAETRTEHEQVMERLVKMLSDLERQVRIISELSGERSLPFISRRKSARDPINMAKALAEHVSALRGHVYQEVPTPDPSLVVFEEKVPDKVLNILRWALDIEGPVLALANVNIDRLVGDNAYLGVTPESFFITRQSALIKQGVIEQEVPLADIRYVRFRERDKGGPSLDIITKDDNIKLTFDNWGSEGEGLAGARRISDVLATAMNLPVTERRSDPLLRIESAEKKTLA